MEFEDAEEAAKTFVQEYSTEQRMAAMRMRNGQGDVLYDALEGNETYTLSDFTGFDTRGGPSNRTGRIFFQFFKEEGILEEDGDAYRPSSDVAPEEVVEELRELHWSYLK